MAKWTDMCGAITMAETLLSLEDLAVHFKVGNAFAGACRSVRQAAHASGWVFHHAACTGCAVAPSSVSRFAENVAISCLSAV